MKHPRKIELLAPAKNAETAIEAIRHGADAVYIGAPSHGARKAAANTVEDIARVTDYAHRFGARVYVTLNTLIYPDEIREVERLVARLYSIGTDALIVQDMGLLRMDIPPIALHASTQCDIRTPQKARFLADMGFSQLVLPREMTLEEMRAVSEAVPDTPLEAFVHGALCVSYSGDCQAGFITQGRSANRGECPQICRHRFDLTDSRGNKLIEGRHLLSLRDLNRSELIPEMLEAGVSSFKIEGRLKDAAYVKNVVAAYRKKIDEAIAGNPEKYVRASFGVTDLSFVPDLNESFNRGYTTYFTTSARPTQKMASMLSPKWTGTEVGEVITCRGRSIRARLSTPIANGDGLGYFDTAGMFQGFKVNRAEGADLFPGTPQRIAPGTKLYRNHNRLREEEMERPTARRLIDVGMTLRPTPRGIALDISDGYGHCASASADLPHEQAKKPQTEARADTLSRLGDTDFKSASIDDRCGESFIPLSRLATLRRDAVTALETAIQASHTYDYRGPERTEAKWPEGEALSYHDNVANPKAEVFYRSHGVTEIEPTLETQPKQRRERRVMTTRYCLRRETGHCLLTPSGREWPRELFLESGPDRFRLEFDCKSCRMHLLHLPPNKETAERRR